MSWSLPTAILLSLSQLQSGAAVAPGSGSPMPMPGLQSSARVVRDTNGLAHVQAATLHDLYYMAGRVHSEDRFWQMDTLRRLARGTLAELLGSGALPTDIQLRTMGLLRAAERSLPVLMPQTRAALEAYAEGVNSWLQENPLPPEYGALEITQTVPWTALDCVAIAKLIAFNRSFELDIGPTITLQTYMAAGQMVGFNGAALFAEDLWRIQPFDETATILAGSASTLRKNGQRHWAQGLQNFLHPRTIEMADEYLQELKKMPAFETILERKKRPGSNALAVSGRLSTTGRALVANDTHLTMAQPSTFYPYHLRCGNLDVIGESFAGIPFVILGHNKSISWGGATFYVDVTDTFQEQVLPDTNSPSGLSTVHAGQLEPIVPIPEVFRMNVLGDGQADHLVVVPPGGDVPAYTLVVPRRNNGPIVKLDRTQGFALSVQYTGASATRELDTFLIWNAARNLADFQRGFEFFDVGGLNFVYGDIKGNIAYFSSSEVPVREDLQAGTVNGVPPWFIRNGAGGNEWLPVQHPQPNQALPYEILPAAEMPHIINQRSGWVANCNNDPVGVTFDNNALNQLRPGGGIFYLAAYFDSFRATRLTEILGECLAQRGKLSLADLVAMQADNVMLDAEVLVPYILQAWANAGSSSEPILAAFRANEKVAQAVERLGAWNGSTPTGIPEGYDSAAGSPTAEQIANSVAASIYSMWRGQFIRNTLDVPLVQMGLPVTDDEHALPALRHLLENFSVNQGIGASGLNFCNVPGVSSASDRRDILILQSLTGALDRCASDDFAAAFNKSSELNDYRWGRVHRLILTHLLGGPFNVPPALGLWPPSLAGLSGIPSDGGVGTLDAGIHTLRANLVDDFIFPVGPAMRFVSECAPGGVRASTSLPGDVSGVPGSPWYLNKLADYMGHVQFPLLFRPVDVKNGAALESKFVAPQQ